MVEESKLFGLLGILAFLGFLAFLAVIMWWMRQAPTVTPTDIAKAREIAGRLP